MHGAGALARLHSSNRTWALQSHLLVMQGIAWTWGHPAGPWRAVGAAAGAVGWRWPVTLLLGSAPVILLWYRLGSISLGWPQLRGRLRPIQVAILAALLAGMVTFAWVYATSPEAASGARTGPSRSNLAVQSGAPV